VPKWEKGWEREGTRPKINNEGPRKGQNRAGDSKKKSEKKKIKSWDPSLNGAIEELYRSEGKEGRWRAIKTP